MSCLNVEWSLSLGRSVPHLGRPRENKLKTVPVAVNKTFAGIPPIFLCTLLKKASRHASTRFFLYRVAYELDIRRGRDTWEYVSELRGIVRASWVEAEVFL